MAICKVTPKCYNESKYPLIERARKGVFLWSNMTRHDEKTLEEQLRELQSLLVKPGVKIVGALGYYLNFLNPLAKSTKNGIHEAKKSSTREQKNRGITWIDIENPDRREINKLAEQYQFHPLYLEFCLQKGQLAQIEKEESYLFMLFHVPRYYQTEDKIVTDQICIFLGKNYLITVHEDTTSSLRNLFNATENEKERRNAYFKKSSSYLLYNILDNLSKDISVLLQTTMQELEDIEDLVFDVKISGAYKISQLRQKIVRQRRVLGTFRHILEELSSNANHFSEENMSRYYDNIANTINKFWETLGESRETIEIYKDADFIVSTEKTNQILSVLTIIFTLTIPATVIGTFYGMNILLPGGLEAGSWTFFGHYTTMILILIVSALPATIMLGYFKFKNWL